MMIVVGYREARGVEGERRIQRFQFHLSYIRTLYIVELPTLPQH